MNNEPTMNGEEGRVEWQDPNKVKAPAGKEVLIAYGVSNGSGTRYAVAWRRGDAYEMSNGADSPTSLYPHEHKPNNNATKVFAWLAFDNFYYFTEAS